MKPVIFFASLATALLVACGGNPNDPAVKRARLEKLKDQQTKTGEEIAKLEDDLAKTDTSFHKKEKPKLVAVQALAPVNFTHYIDLQGRIDALNIAYVTPRNGQGGQVKAVYVKQGDNVRKGQVLLKLDDVLLRQNLENANISLAHAKDLFQRRQNLWNDKIGTEVDYINAKNAVDQAQKQVDIIKEQIDQTNVTADIDGVADIVNVRVGEIFSPAGQQIRIVNTGNLKAVAQVPENYLDAVRVGSNVKVVLPELNNKTIDTRVTVSGKLIDPATRSFYIEAKIPFDRDFHPNQIALVKIQDYTATNALTVPVATVQNDLSGKYVMVAVKEGNRLVARRKVVTIGQLYNDSIEIKSGLVAGDQVITDGFQSLYDGQPLTTQAS